MIRGDCELQRCNVIVTIEKAAMVAPLYTERTRRRADAALECSRNEYMYQFKCPNQKPAVRNKCGQR